MPTVKRVTFVTVKDTLVHIMQSPFIDDTMQQTYAYSTTYLLDKAHFAECYEQSKIPDASLKPYYKAIGLGLIGIALIFTDISLYLAYFFVGLGVIEALNVRFHKAWWLMRQMMSKAASNQVTLTLNEQGIHSHSQYVNSEILWTDTYRVKETEKGFLITHKTGTNYVSASILDEAALTFIRSKL